MEVIWQVSNDTHRLSIYQDGDPPSPREWCNLGTMICAHSRYDLGDERAENLGAYDNWDDWHQHELGDVISLPLYMYEHSGITIRTRPFSCPWDSGQVGFIYITKEDVRNQWNVKRISPQLYKKVEAILEQEVKTYDMWSNNQVFGFVIEEIHKCGECGTVEYENLDSCWGFYGEKLDEILKDMEEHIDSQFDNLIDLLKKEAA